MGHRLGWLVFGLGKFCERHSLPVDFEFDLNRGPATFRDLLRLCHSMVPFVKTVCCSKPFSLGFVCNQSGRPVGPVRDRYIPDWVLSKLPNGYYWCWYWRDLKNGLKRHWQNVCVQCGAPLVILIGMCSRQSLRLAPTACPVMSGAIGSQPSRYSKRSIRSLG